MDTLLRLLTTVLPMVYLMAVVAYLSDFVGFHPVAAKAARRFMDLAIVAHAGQIAVRSIVYAHVPLASKAEVMGTVAFAIACVYVLVERRTRVERTGAFVIGVVWVLQTLSSALLEPVVHFPPLLQSPLFALHTGSAVLGYAAFGLSAVYGVLFLVLHRALKRRRFGMFFDRLPSLEVLTKMSLSAAGVGAGFLGLAIVLGLIWASRAFPGTVFDPKVVLTSVVWLIYVTVLVAHHKFKWSRRRAIGLSLMAFALLIVSALAIAFGLPSFHAFV